MRFFTNKSIWTKIIIMLIFVLIFEFIVTKPSLGAEVTDAVVEGGGKLLTPVMSLVASLGDGIMTVMQDVVMGNNATIMPVDVDADFWTILGQIVTAVVTIVACVAVVIGAIASGGTVIAIVAAAAKGILPIVAGGLAIGTLVIPVTVSTGSAQMSSVSASIFPDTVKVPSTLYLPAFNYSPEEIFQGKVLLFNVDFFGDPIEIKQDSDGNYYYTNDKGEKVITSRQNIAEDLSQTVSRWYVGIRNIALVAMLIVLLYIGIRMLLSTLASDKAKYKQMIQDWLVGLMLLFLMHYIMAFSVTLVQKLTQVVATGVDENAYFVAFPVDENGKIVDWFNKYDLSYMLYGKDGSQLTTDGTVDVNKDDVGFVLYPTNLLGKLRLDMQFDAGGFSYVGYVICYLVLVFFTVYFTFIYLRRVLYMAFLTMIAPIVAMTYPIDKINDGSAQGFSKWFREYIFNLLIQPLHLLLYYMLITSAFELAGENIVYSIVAIGFMIPAEKLLRSLFGFEKANTPSAANGAAGGALAMAGISNISRAITGHGKRNDNTVSGGENKAIGSGNNKGSVRQVGNLFDDKDIVDETAVLARNSGELASTVGVGGAVGTLVAENTNNNEENKTEPRQDVSNKNVNNQLEKSPDIRDNIDSSEDEKDGETLKIKSDNIPNTNDNKKFRKIKGFARAAKRDAIKYSTRLAPYARDLSNHVVKPIVGVSGAALAAGVGVAAGVATGDPSDVLRNAAAGAGAGYMAGRGVYNNANQNIAKFANNREQTLIRMAEESNDEEFKKMAKEEVLRGRRKEYKKAFKKNNYDSKEVEELVKTGVIDKYIANDIDVESAVAAEGYRKETGASQDKAIAVSRTFDRVGDSYKGADSAKWQKQFASEYRDKANLDEKQAEKTAKETWKEIGKFRKQKRKYIG